MQALKARTTLRAFFTPGDGRLIHYTEVNQIT